MKKFRKFVKVLLWAIFGTIMLLFLFGAVKYKGSFGQYISMLNSKIWSVEIKNLNLTHPKTFFDLFLEGKQPPVQTGNQKQLKYENLSGVVQSGVLMTGENSGDLDVYDPSFQQGFDAYFEGEENAGNESYSGGEQSFGFKNE